MAALFFGRFLVEQGIVTAEELSRALEHQEKTNRKFGELAVSLELVTEDQVGEMLDLQTREDVQLGEAAVRLGLLTEDQVANVLATQERVHVKLGEALVATGALSSSEVVQHLERFQAVQPAPETETLAPGGDPMGLAAPLIEIARKLLHRLGGIRSKIEACRVGTWPSISEALCLGHVEVRGQLVGRIALRAQLAVGAQIATRMIGEQVESDDAESVADACLEFLNLVAGRLADRWSAEGQRIECGLPSAGPGADSPTGLSSLFVRLQTPEGFMDFLTCVSATRR